MVYNEYRNVQNHSTGANESVFCIQLDSIGMTRYEKVCKFIWHICVEDQFDEDLNPERSKEGKRSNEFSC
jgi:hypothetical protein